MHELSLVQSLLEILKGYTMKKGFQHISTVKLSVGRLSCVEPKALKFAFDIQAEGTSAEGALLEFDIRPAILYCFSCDREYEVVAYEAACPKCKCSDVLLTGGTEELQLIEIDVE